MQDHENDDFDFYSPKKQVKNEPEAEEPTVIAGNNFYSGMRFTINGLLFEVTSPNRIQCVESIEELEKKIPELYPIISEKQLEAYRRKFSMTVFDVSGSNYDVFFRKTGVDMGKVKKCYYEPKNASKYDSAKINEEIKKRDLNWELK